MTATSLDLSQIKTDALSSAATFRTLIGLGSSDAVTFSQLTIVDTPLVRDAANALAQRNGTNAQTFRLYNTYTSSTSYERGFMRWNSNVLEIGTEAGSGGGSNRAINFVTSTFTRWQISTDGHLLGLINRGYDLGGASNRCRTVFTKDYNGDGFVQLSEMGVPTTPAINTCRIYAKDNGSGNTQLVSLMPDGVETILSEQNRSQISYPLTWNDGATTFTGVKLDVTDTASASGSLLMDLQVGGSSKFAINKSGYITAPSAGRLLIGNTSVAQWTNSYLGTIGRPLAIFDATLANPVYLDRDAANTLAQRNGTNAQTFNIYNTYTSSTSYERGFMRWNSNVLEIGTEFGSSGGVSRSIEIYSQTGVIIQPNASASRRIGFGNLYVRPETTAVVNLGTSTNSWKDIFLHPSSSLTPTNNGDLCIESTNDTTLTFKYKGSDGTVRSGTITLS